jgi:TAP-like protein
MGFSGNLLDHAYSTSIDVPGNLIIWTKLCAEATSIVSNSCPFANASLHVNGDPVEDMLNRVGYIIGNFSHRQYYYESESLDPFVYTIEFLTLIIARGLATPIGWSFLSDDLLIFEGIIATDGPEVPPRGVNISNTVALTPPKAIFNNDWDNSENIPANADLYYAILCGNANLTGINTVSDFTNYVSQQINEETLIAASYLDMAICLNWPVQSGVNPSIALWQASKTAPKTANKILIIGGTENSIYSLQNAFETYEYIGVHNAVFLTNQAIGYGITEQPNNCSYNAVRNFMLNGTT